MFRKYKSFKYSCIGLLSFLLFTTNVVAGKELDEGIRLFNNNDYYSAIEILKKAAISEPDNPEPHLWLSKCYQELYEINKFSNEINLYNDLKHKKELNSKPESNITIDNTQENRQNDEKSVNISTPFDNGESLLSFIDSDSLKILKQFYLPIRSKHILFSNDGKFFITAGNADKNIINIWKIETR